MMIPLRRRSTKHELRLLTAHIAQLEQKILDLQQMLLLTPAHLPTTGPITPIPERPRLFLDRYPERKISKVYLIKQSREVITLDQADNRLEELCGPLYKVGNTILKQFQGKIQEVDAITGEHRTISLALPQLAH